MQKRRALFKIGIVYQTPLELVQKIPTVLKSIVEAQSLVTFDRAHFVSYGDFSLNYEVVYYVLDADMGKYLDIQQAINFGIFEAFQQMGVEFAYPTQTLLLTNQPAEIPP